MKISRVLVFSFVCFPMFADQVRKAYVDGFSGPGWISLGKRDFAQVNCDPETFQFGEKPGTLHCTGYPFGGLRSVKSYKNFEMVLEWRHNKYAGNAGIFIWCPKKILDSLPRGQLPQGIEIQILDIGYEENFLKNKKKRSDWFTSHGDVFPVGVGSMKAMNPELTYNEKNETWKVGNPSSTRSFPSKRLTRPHGEWNHYYFRAINGEIRLWVNGEEVSGGFECNPKEGHLVMESEGSPVDFRGMRLRELP